MNITVLNYLDENYLKKASGATDAASEAAACGMTFEQILNDTMDVSAQSDDAQNIADDSVNSKVQTLLNIDAAIAEARLSGAGGLSVYSARARELGVGAYAPAEQTSYTFSASGTSYTGTAAAACGDILQCSDELNSYFDEASQTYQVDAKLLKAIAKAESNFTYDAVSSAGAIGIMQLMPSTASGLGVTDAYDARENILGGAKYISQLLDKYDGNVSYALAAYNAGSGNVDKYGGIPPFTETQNYVKKVMEYYES